MEFNNESYIRRCAIIKTLKYSKFLPRTAVYDSKLIFEKYMDYNFTIFEIQNWSHDYNIFD